MKEEIRDKISAAFSQAEIGRRMGCSQQTVFQWLNGTIPPKRVIPLCELLGWVVTPHELRPDLHPNPTSGVPEEILKSHFNDPKCLSTHQDTDAA
ncbi:transcriptional regulator [Salmonella enterica]|uniref:transcriptional regulator n=1 Tax=Salmonella enterica TaxID=28901 RepID=UPI00138EAC15|nr:helix-turn-helix domain-containing protein [Salmonella enterica]